MPDYSHIRWYPYSIKYLASLQQLHAEKDINALIYFPHGLGDIVMFTSVARFFTTKNKRLFFTRHGDDYVAGVEGAEHLTPIYTGVKNPHTNDGAYLGHKHFDIRRNGASINVTGLMFDALTQNNVTHVLNEPFYEPGANRQFPLHSKQRICLNNIYTALTAEEKSLLNEPLPPAINTVPSQVVLNAVIARLKTQTTWRSGHPLIVITRYGATSAGKNWGHLFRDDCFPNEGDEAREFIRLCLQKNPNTVFISMEHSQVSGVNSLRDKTLQTHSYSDLFSPLNENEFSIPYVSILRALFHTATAHVGVPTGATGVAQQCPNLRNIILWIEFSPERYFEPRNNTINIVSSNQPGRVTSINSLPDNVRNWYNVFFVNTPNITGKDVFKHVEYLL